MIKSYHAAAAFALFTAVSSLEAAPTRLQVFVTKDEAKAKAAAAKLNTAGCGPAEVRPAGSLYKVLSRAYPSLGEANFARPALRGAGYLDIFAVEDASATVAGDQRTELGDSIPSITTQSAFEQVRFDYKLAKPAKKTARITPAQEALNNEAASESDLLAKGKAYWSKKHASSAVAAFDAFIRRFGDSPQAAQAKMMRAYWLVEAGETRSAQVQFESVAAEHANSLEAGEAMLRIGYLQLKAREDAAALRTFHGVAGGKFPAAPDVRAEATLRTAALFHRGKDLDSADATYAVIASVFTDPELKAFAQMQRAGLALEKAWNGKSTFGEARAICDDVLTRYPNASKLTRATAALIALETLCYEKDYAGAVKREQSALAELSGTAEAALGYYWIAKARLETGDADGAANILESIIEADLPVGDRFKGIDSKPQARRLASKAYEKMGKAEKAKAVLERK